MPTDWQNIEGNETYHGMQRLGRKMQAVVADTLDALCVCSDPGIGKTWTIERYLKKGRVPHKKGNPASEKALVMLLWEVQQLADAEGRRGVVVLDDAERFLRSRAMISQIKNAISAQSVTYQTAEITKNEVRRVTGHQLYDPTLPPPSFKVNLAFIVATNLDLTTPEKRTKLKVDIGFEALISRGLRPDWITSDAFSRFHYTIWMIAKGKLFGTFGMSLADAAETLQFFYDNAHLMPSPDLRVAVRLANLIKKGGNYRQAWADEVQVQGQPTSFRPVTRNAFTTTPTIITPTMAKALIPPNYAQPQAVPNAPQPAPTPVVQPALKPSQPVPHRSAQEILAESKARREAEAVPEAKAESTPKAPSRNPLYDELAAKINAEMARQYDETVQDDDEPTIKRKSTRRKKQPNIVPQYLG